MINDLNYKFKLWNCKKNCKEKKADTGDSEAKNRVE